MIAVYLLILGVPNPHFHPNVPDIAIESEASVGTDQLSFHLTREKVDRVNVKFDPDTNTHALDIRLSSAGHREFIDFQEGRIGQQIRFYVADHLVSEPYLTELVLGRNLFLTANFTLKEARAIKAILVAKK